MYRIIPYLLFLSPWIPNLLYGQTEVQQENDQWRAIVKDKEEKEIELNETLVKKVEAIRELEQRLLQEKRSYEAELIRQREEDMNTVSFVIGSCSFFCSLKKR